MTYNQHYSIDKYKNAAMLREWQRSIDESEEDDEELLICDDCGNIALSIETCNNCGDKVCWDCQYYSADLVFCFDCFAGQYREYEEI